MINKSQGHFPLQEGFLIFLKWYIGTHGFKVKMLEGVLESSHITASSNARHRLKLCFGVVLGKMMELDFILFSVCMHQKEKNGGLYC